MPAHCRHQAHTWVLIQGKRPASYRMRKVCRGSVPTVGVSARRTLFAACCRGPEARGNAQSQPKQRPRSHPVSGRHTQPDPLCPAGSPSHPVFGRPIKVKPPGLRQAHPAQTTRSSAVPPRQNADLQQSTQAERQSTADPFTPNPAFRSYPIYIDVNSWIDRFLLCELSTNPDGLVASLFLAKPQGVVVVGVFAAKL